MSEFSRRQAQIRRLMDRFGVEALLLQRASSFAWATCGASSYINTAATNGEASLLITPEGRFLIANNIETPRLGQEERLEAQGWQIRQSPWYQPGDDIARLTAGLKLGADGAAPGAVDLSGPISLERSLLSPEEGARFADLGERCAAAMDAAARAVRPGMSEQQIAARLGMEAQARGAQPVVNLIATDQRVYLYRHPLPTDKVMEKYAMLVLCGRRQGLVCSLTRLVHFGPLPDELRRKQEAVARIDALLIDGSRPGTPVAELFARARQAYADLGFADEWQFHHQGGPAGYEPREFVATPQTEAVISRGQVYAWNPSITGTKSEDTILVGADGSQILTAIPDWPMVEAYAGWHARPRPAILVR